VDQPDEQLTGSAMSRASLARANGRASTTEIPEMLEVTPGAERSGECLSMVVVLGLRYPGYQERVDLDIC
jgi:hypothetical protein